MARSGTFLAVDVGASKVVVAEFVAVRNSVPRLLRYAIAPLELDLEKEQQGGDVVVQTLRRIMREHEMRPGPLLLTISGQSVFPRYVKLPPVARDKLMQIIRYEAEQNVPFPIEDVVWDFQLLEGEHEEDVNVMLVAVKNESVTTLTAALAALRMEPEIVDAAPMALYNTAAHCYPDAEGCTMVLDIGARSSNVIFVESGRIFTRSVPVAGNAITIELAKELNVSFGEAEALKRTYGQVGLGGVTTTGADEYGEHISKTVRTVLTRLHAEVNRSINFYRSQQGGNPPERVLLCGGSSILPNTDTFFEEKLHVPVEYLNPFRRVPADDGIPEARLQQDMHLLGEVVGAALRRSPAAAVEINLMPPHLVATKNFRRRIPYLATAAASVVLTLIVFWLNQVQWRGLRNQQLTAVNQMISADQSVRERLAGVLAQRRDAQARASAIVDLINRRYQWLRFLDAVHACMLEGMWLTSIRPEAPVDGLVRHVDISGRGFEDLLKAGDQADATAIEVFRNRLREQPLFGDDTNIIQIPIPKPGDFTREFTIRIALEQPFVVVDK